MSQKQRLLDKESYQKQLKQKQQKAAIERQQALIKQKMAQIQAQSEGQPENDQALKVVKPKSKVKPYLFILILLVLAVLPYPKVIVYEKLGVVAESIYIPSRFGSQDFILDSHYQINLDAQQRWLYLCDNQNLKQCTRYDVVEVKGFFAAVKLFFTGSH